MEKKEQRRIGENIFYTYPSDVKRGLNEEKLKYNVHCVHVVFVSVFLIHA